MNEKPSTLPIPVSPNIMKNRVFTGYFKHRNTPPMSYSFNFVGPLREARERWRKHCEVMGYIYLQCVPAIVDLDHREKLRNEVDADYYVDE